jgi:hypothetical protein
MEALRAVRGCEAGESAGRVQVPESQDWVLGLPRFQFLSSHPEPSLTQVCPRVCQDLSSVSGQRQVTPSRTKPPKPPKDSLHNGQSWANPSKAGSKAGSTEPSTGARS